MKLERHVCTTFSAQPPADAEFCIIQSSLADGAQVRLCFFFVSIFAIFYSHTCRVLTLVPTTFSARTNVPCSRSLVGSE
jgi:hypothetical protein